MRPIKGDFFSIMFHYVRPSEVSNLKYLNLNKFILMLDNLMSEFGIVTQDQWEGFRKFGKRPSGALLTFDDGLKDHFNFVAPVLKERGLFGIFYVCTDPLINKPLSVHLSHYLLAHHDPHTIWQSLLSADSDLVWQVAKDELAQTAYVSHNEALLIKNIKKAINWLPYNSDREQLILEIFRELSKLSFQEFVSQWYLNEKEISLLSMLGFEIGSHTCSHRLLSRLDLRDIRYELNESKSALENVSTNSIRSFCFPYGGERSYNKEILEELKKSQYSDAFSVKSSVIGKESTFELHRFDCNFFLP